MNFIEKKYSTFMNILLKVLLFLVILGSLAMCVLNFFHIPFIDIIISVLITLLLFTIFASIFYFINKALNKGFSDKKLLIIILFFAFLLRLIWILAINVKPFSDFETILLSGQSFAAGNFSVFKGTSYLARYPHLTITAIYFGLFAKLFKNVLMPIKIVNIILSTISVYIIYLISMELYKEKKKSINITYMAAIFPPFIFFNSVLCSENLAIPFFLGSLYLFILILKNKISLLWIIASGVLLSIGNLFRMVAPLIIVAYIFYILVYNLNKKGILISLLIVISFAVPFYSTNALLLKLNITEYSFWHGREPGITSILKGTNINSLGMWNVEDSKIPDKYHFDYDKIQSASLAIIKERLTTTPFYKLAGFYIVKFIAQWSSGDFAGLFWATGVTNILSATFTMNTVLFFYSEVFYIILLLLVYKQLFRMKQEQNKILNLLYIIFCGFGLLYLIIEQQPRYGFIIAWVFLLISNPSFDLFKKKK